MKAMEAVMLLVIKRSSTYKKMISNYHHTSLYTHFDHIYTFGSFVKAERHPSWHTMILGPVSTHRVISTICKPKKDLVCMPQAASYISPHEYLHVERHSLNPYDALPSAWMPQWLKLGRWSPSLPLVQRSHGSPLLGPGIPFCNPP